MILIKRLYIFDNYLYNFKRDIIGVLLRIYIIFCRYYSLYKKWYFRYIFMYIINNKKYLNGIVKLNLKLFLCMCEKKY